MSRSPDLVDVFSRILDGRAAEISVAEVVSIQSWDRALQVVSARPVVQTNSGTDRSLVERVPVVFPGAYWDLQPSEVGLLIVGGVNWRNWWRTGEVGPPEDRAIHELSNGLFIPGLRTQSNPRNVPANSMVLEKPVAGGSVRLGEPLAFKAVVHEDLLWGLAAFLNAIDAWGGTAHANWAAAAAAFTVNVTPTIANITNAITAGDYQSPSVYVED